MKLDLDKIEEASDASRRTFHAPLISPDELAALVRIARAAAAWRNHFYYTARHVECVAEADMVNALREAGL